MPTPPPLTTDQRRQAFEKSLRLRQDRAELKRWLIAMADGRPAVYPVERFKVALDFPVAQGMKVIDLLTALPGVGDTKARALLEAAKIPANNTVRRVGPKQRERLFQALNTKKPRR